MGADGRIYVLAGKVEKSGSSVIYPALGELALDIYEPNSNRWVPAPTAPSSYTSMYRHLVRRRDPKDPEGGLRKRLTDTPTTLQLDSEYPPGGAGADGRIYWFSKIGPIYFDAVEGSWGQGEPVVYEEKQDTYVPRVARWSRIMGATGVGPGGKFYLVGGTGYPNVTRGSRERYRVLSSLEVYDPKTRHWEERAPMKHARQMPAVAFGPDGKLYVFGGFGALGFRRQEEGESDADYKARSNRERSLARNALRSVEAYDPKTDTWEDRAPMPAGRQSMGAALGADGRIYVVGGTPRYTNPVPKAEVFIYDPKTDSWSEGPPLNHPRYHHAVVATPDGKIWAIGGTNGTNVRGALPSGEPEGLVRPIEMLETAPGEAGSAD